MLVVVDTNLFISALLKPSSNPGIVLDNLFNNNLSLALSNEQFAEIEKSLNYPKIKNP